MPHHEPEALAVLEIDGLGRALKAQDAALKQAEVDVFAFTPLSPGKIALLFRGDIASVESALENADASAGAFRLDLLFIPGITPHLLERIALCPGSVLDFLGGWAHSGSWWLAHLLWLAHPLF